MGFHRLKYKKKTRQDMIDLSTQFMNVMATRRSVRGFSNEDIPDIVLENIIREVNSIKPSKLLRRLSLYRNKYNNREKNIITGQSNL